MYEIRPDDLSVSGVLAMVLLFKVHSSRRSFPASGNSATVVGSLLAQEYSSPSDFPTDCMFRSRVMWDPMWSQLSRILSCRE